MCRMTDTGTRWKAAIDLPGFGDEVLYWAVPYNGETRYTRAVSKWEPDYDYIRMWLKPMYAVRVKARSI